MVLDQGEVWSWGENCYGALGHGNETALKNVFAPEKVPLDAAITKVSCGDRHTAMIDVNGKVHVCGSNEHGQLGLGYIDC